MALLLALLVDVQACARKVAPPARASATLAFVGDILLDSAPGASIARGEDPFGPTAALLESADVVVGNLECPVAMAGEAVAKIFTFRAHPRSVPVLARHVDAVSLANNHSGDYGSVALLETLAALDNAAVQHFGAGSNLAAAHEPLMLERNGVRIALLGYDDFQPRAFEAQVELPGVAWAEGEQIEYDIHRARRAGANVVIPFFHWGWENEPGPSEQQRDLARRSINAGADAVIGAHPHITQGAELYRGKPIIYSLGNFVFDLFDEPANRKGWILKLIVDAQGVASFTTASIMLDDQGTPTPDLEADTPCAERGSTAVAVCDQVPNTPSQP